MAASVGVGLWALNGDAAPQAPGTTPPAANPAAPEGPTASPPPAPAPAPAPAPQPAPIAATGTYDVRVCTVVSDRASHDAVLRLCSIVRQILASASNGGVTFRADAPWVTIGGTYNVLTGEFSLSTSGTVAGFLNVSATLRGGVNSSGLFTGVLEYGANGALPQGAPVSYQIQAQRR